MKARAAAALAAAMSFSVSAVADGAGTPETTCGVQIARLDRHDGSAWRDGWVYDPRDGKKYRAVVRAKGRELAIRAYVGVEVLGQTEVLKRVNSLPAAPVCGA